MKKLTLICIALLLCIAWIVSVDCVMSVIERRDAAKRHEEIMNAIADPDSVDTEISESTSKRMSFTIRPEQWKK